MPVRVDASAADVAVDPYGPVSLHFVVGEDFARMWTAALAHCHNRFADARRASAANGPAASGVSHPTASRCSTRSGRTPTCRRLQPRVHDDRRRRPGRRRVARRPAGPVGTVPLHPLRTGAAAPHQQGHLPLELRGGQAPRCAGRRAHLRAPAGRHLATARRRVVSSASAPGSCPAAGSVDRDRAAPPCGSWRCTRSARGHGARRSRCSRR